MAELRCSEQLARWIPQLALCVLALFAPLSAQRVPDVRLDTDPPGAQDSRFPQLATSGSSVYAAWDDWRYAGNPFVIINASLDRGATWLDNTVQLGSGRSRCPQIAASGSSVYVAFQDCRSGGPGPDIYFNYSADRGLTWQNSDVQLNTNRAGSATSTAPQVAASGSTVYVTWEDFRNTYSSVGADILLNLSNDGGASWLTSDLQLNTASPSARYPQLASSGSSVYVTWQDHRNGSGHDIYLNYSADGGATWLSSDLRLDTDPAGAAHSASPQIAVAGSSVFVTWEDHRNGRKDIYFNYSADAGSTWLVHDMRLDTDPAGTADSHLPQITASGSSVYVTWADERSLSGARDIYFNRSLDGGATWLAADVRLDTDPAGAANSVFPQIAASGSSVAVTWQDSRHGGTADIYFNRSIDRGTSWLGTDVRLNSDPPGVGISALPVIAVSGPSVYVAWQDGRSAIGSNNLDIYFNVPFAALSYGPPTAGTAGVSPQLAATGAPTLGSAISLDVSQGLGAATGALWVGLGPSSMTSVPLFGGTLLVQPSVAAPLLLGGAPGAAGAGGTSLPLTIPALPALVGANLNFQALVLDAGAAFGISMTNGLELWIG